MTRTEALVHLAAAIHQRPIDDHTRKELTTIGVAVYAQRLLERLDGWAGPLHFDPEPADDETPERSGIRVQIAGDDGGDVLLDIDASELAAFGEFTGNAAVAHFGKGGRLGRELVLRVFRDGENS